MNISRCCSLFSRRNNQPINQYNSIEESANSSNISTNIKPIAAKTSTEKIETSTQQPKSMDIRKKHSNPRASLRKFFLHRSISSSSNISQFSSNCSLPDCHVNANLQVAKLLSQRPRSGNPNFVFFPDGTFQPVEALELDDGLKKLMTEKKKLQEQLDQLAKRHATFDKEIRAPNKPQEVRNKLAVERDYLRNNKRTLTLAIRKVREEIYQYKRARNIQ